MSRGVGLGRIYNAVPVVIPIDLDNSQSGAKIDMKDYGGVDLVFITGDGAAGRDLTFTLKRHTDVSDSSGAVFPSTAFVASPWYYKRSDTTVVGVTTAWVKSTFTDSDGDSIVLDDTEGEDSRLIVVPIEASQLGDGYSAISVSAVVAGGSGAKLGACIALLRDPQVMRTPANIANVAF